VPRGAVICLLAAATVAAGCGGDGDDERARAIDAAGGAYAEAVDAGTDLEPGPCIAERLDGLEDWVVDIAHDPRQPTDDEPANQCSRFREGEATHFVELDPDGKLIRAE
jgi:hypothetical protein